jgi:hypothetical protein
LQLSRPDVTSVLKDGGRSGTAGRSRQLTRRVLVVLQLASSVVLALAAGLLIRSLIELNRIDLGFNPNGVLTAQLQVPATDYQSKLKFDEKVSHLFLSALSREPTRRESESSRMILANSGGNEAVALEDIWWALLNSNEFILDH